MRLYYTKVKSYHCKFSILYHILIVMQQKQDFNRYKSLETERLLIRIPKSIDRDMLFFMRTNKEVNIYIKRNKPQTLEDIDVFINDRLKDRDKRVSLYWVITLKEEPNQCIGAISLWHFSEDRRTAEVGYDLHPDYQGKGIMREALLNVVSFGFNILNLHTIEAYTHRENMPSRKLLEKQGFSLTDKKDDDFPTNLVYEYKR